MARVASRIMGLAVAAISLGVAAFGLARWLHADIASWYDGKELALGAAVMVLLSLSFVLARALAPQASTPISNRLSASKR
jgi:high-affinity nickel-transport protein